MKTYRVMCITKSMPNGGHEHITHIGGIGATRWKLTKEDAIRRIDTKEEAFYTFDDTNTKKAYIGVVREAGKLPYLRTHADGLWNNNLLALPFCSNEHLLIG